MAQNYQEFRRLIESILQDDGEKLSDQADKDRAIDMAVNAYSKNKPRTIKKDVSASGAYDYDMPSEWVDNFSMLLSVEYPADEQDPIYLDQDDFLVYNNGTEDRLRFPSSSPSSGYTIRLEITIKWSLTDTTCNIPSQDFDALASLAASICLRMLAHHYAQTTDPSISADIIDYTRKSIEYSTLADNMENIYRKHMGLPELGSKVESSASAASQVKDLDIQFPFGMDYLTHPKRLR